MISRSETARCASCGNPLESSFTTDGSGGLVRLVRPCPRCRIVFKGARRVVRAPKPRRPRGGPIGNHHKPVFDEQHRPRCIRCGEVLEWNRRGRTPVFCVAHKKRRV